MWLICAVGTAVCFGTSNSIFKWGASKNLSKVTIQFFFNLFAFVFVLIYGIAKGMVDMAPLSLAVGAIIGVCNANGNLQMTRAFEKGPASVTSTIIAMNSVLVVVATAIFFPEYVPPLHWIGVALMVAAAVAVQYQKSSSTPFEYKSWLTRCLYALFSIGCVGILMKMGANLHVDFYSLILALYFGGTVFLGVLARKEFKQLAHRKPEVSLGFFVSLLSVTGYSCYLFALETGPASVVFPVISLNCLIVMLAGLWLFHEKLRNYQWIGMIVAVIGLVLTKI